MTRKTTGWENRLIAYLATISTKPFTPSDLDCAMFGARGYAMMTGDFTEVEKFEGTYTTIAKGLAKLKRKGFADHIEYVASKLDEHPSPLFATRGDLAAVETGEGGFALGIVQGENIYVMTLTGLGIVRLEKAVRAFAV